MNKYLKALEFQKIQILKLQVVLKNIIRDGEEVNKIINCYYNKVF